jgi:hypothetical protein
MQKLTRGPMTGDPMLRPANREPFSRRLLREYEQFLCILLLAGTILLSACGGGPSNSQQQNAKLSGNWQFILTNTSDLTVKSGLQGGFLLQNNGSLSGEVAYSNVLQGSQEPCNSGSAPITGTINGQTISLTAVAGTQTFALTGTLSSDGSTILGMYTATPGPVVAGTTIPCGAGTAVGTTLPWTASSVPPLTGSITGSFHSTIGTNIGNEDFPVTGSLTQGENIGASNATVTGTLSFIDPTTLASDYPCIETASLNGQISGNNVILQIIAVNGANIGQIGGTPGSGVSPVTFHSVSPNGSVLDSPVTPGYAISSPACPGSGIASPGDAGNLCLALGSTTACQQPVTLSPASLTFPPQLLGAAATTQTVTLTNSDPSGGALNGLTLQFELFTDQNFAPYSDFNQLPNFTASDNCVTGGEILPPNGTGSAFSLAAGQSCSITASFLPQQSCNWLAPPSLCPSPLSARLIVNSPASADNDKLFSVLITGIGLSLIQPSTPELDFGPEAVGEASLSQLLTFTNSSANPVQILGSAPCLNPPGMATFTFPNDPLTYGSPVSGLQVVVNGNNFPNQITPLLPADTTLTYNCDLDPTSKQPNFQISSDTCTGTTLSSQAGCSLEVTYVPQPATNISSGLDFFLELNTVQCWPPATPPSDCEIDSGRFPVELKANPPSPLRMLPSAGLNFGNVSVGKSSVAQTITLLDDPSVPNAPTVNFIGKVLVSGNYSETDDCPFSLAPGSSCTLTVIFKPSAVGFSPGTLTINYSPEPNGSGQIVYLRGTGQ